MFVAMELGERGEMFNFMNTAPFTENEAKYYFRQLIKGVEYLHSEDIVHRDLKLENLVLDKDFQLKIVDFGASKFPT